MRRVYQRVAVRAGDGGWTVALNERSLRTPAGALLMLPSERLASAIAAEWDAQGQVIDPASMPLFRLAATALDRTAPRRDLIVRDTANYAATDLVCYRAAAPPELVARQQAGWQPLLDWAAQRYDAALACTGGVLPAEQSPAALAAFATFVAAQDDFRLTALHALTAACGSLVIALAVLERRLDAAAAFTLSQLDETFQIESWGEDAEAAQRRTGLAADIDAAARFIALLEG